jgi:hypothetical protein
MTAEAAEDEANTKNVFDHIVGTVTYFWQAVVGAFTPEDVPPARDNFDFAPRGASVTMQHPTCSTRQYAPSRDQSVKNKTAGMDMAMNVATNAGNAAFISD